MAQHHVRHSPLLGTTVEIMVETGGYQVGRLAPSALVCEQRITNELRRLERIFNVYDPDSELSALIRVVGEHHSGPGGIENPAVVDVSSELASVLQLSLEWHDQSNGRFNPLLGKAVMLWASGGDSDMVPEPGQMEWAVAGIGEMPYSVDGQTVTASGRLDGLNLNSLAKGWVLDRAVGQSDPSSAVRSIYVNAGGDICRRGRGELQVRIENPLKPYDNAEPLLTVGFAEGGLATSGGSRRPVEIGGERYSHLLDAKTGRPANEVAAATVVAADTATADVLATVLAVSSLHHAVQLLSSDLFDRYGAAALLVAADGQRHENARWAQLPTADG